MEEPRVAPEPGTQTEENPKRSLPVIEVESEHIVICKVILAWEPKKKRKTNRYVIFNKKSYEILAEIYWNTGWRQYCLYPEPQCVWSTSCLDVVIKFIKEINTAHKAKRGGPQHMIQG